MRELLWWSRLIFQLGYASLKNSSIDHQSSTSRTRYKNNYSTIELKFLFKCLLKSFYSNSQNNITNIIFIFLITFFEFILILMSQFEQFTKVIDGQTSFPVLFWTFVEVPGSCFSLKTLFRNVADTVITKQFPMHVINFEWQAMATALPDCDGFMRWILI